MPGARWRWGLLNKAMVDYVNGEDAAVVVTTTSKRSWDKLSSSPGR